MLAASTTSADTFWGRGSIRSKQICTEKIGRKGLCISRSHSEAVARPTSSNNSSASVRSPSTQNFIHSRSTTCRVGGTGGWACAVFTDSNETLTYIQQWVGDLGVTVTDHILKPPGPYRRILGTYGRIKNRGVKYYCLSVRSH